MTASFVYHHLGLGDHFVCNGLVRELLERDSPDVLYLPTKSRNLVTVSAMYADDPRIKCLPVADDSEVLCLPELKTCRYRYKVGFEKCRKDWDVSFYDSVGVSFAKRWDSFQCSRDAQREESLRAMVRVGLHEPFVLMHKQTSRGTYNIGLEIETRVVEIEPLTANLLDWCGLVESAQRVHCVDSSVIHLAQMLTPKGVFHDIRGPSEEKFDYKTYVEKFKLRPGWVVVPYG